MGGSSPLTRGKQPLAILSALWRGLIPAHAGKTHRALHRRRHEEAHPRSRGENAWSAHSFRNASGSSPLTRGKPARAGSGGTRTGLIPAHAGKTLFRLLWARRWKAHPRSRGENRARQRRGQPMTGSSPLTRGKRGDGHYPRFPSRLIPAHAGKTSSTMGRHAREGAHPRSRGENSD